MHILHLRDVFGHQRRFLPTQLVLGKGAPSSVGPFFLLEVSHVSQKTRAAAFASAGVPAPEAHSLASEKRQLVL